MTPREKVAKVIVEWPEDTYWNGECLRLADAILTALASGSGDHAELARLCDLLDVRQQRLTLDPRHFSTYCPLDAKLDEDAALAVRSLLAENAALRGDVEVARTDLDHLEASFRQRDREATEAERKLAEADKALELAAIRFDEIYEAAEVDDVAYRNEATIHGINGLADVAQAEIRTYLSKEAERG